MLPDSTYKLLKQKHVAIDRKMLRAKALALMAKMDPDAAKWFKGSPDFMRAFESKRKISRRRATTSAPKLPPGQTKESMRQLFLARAAFLVQTHGIRADLVFGADETAQYLTPAKGTTLETTGAANVNVLGSGLLHSQKS
jgi:hypothetical protein